MPQQKQPLEVLYELLYDLLSDVIQVLGKYVVAGIVAGVVSIMLVAILQVSFPQLNPLFITPILAGLAAFAAGSYEPRSKGKSRGSLKKYR